MSIECEARGGLCERWQAPSILVPIGSEQLPLVDFLVRCAESIQDGTNIPSPSPELIGVRDAFLSAGLAALRRTFTPSVWLHYGLYLVSERSSELYAALGEAARQLLGEEYVTEFFFMHKPPGLRVRFQTAGHRHSTVDDVLRNQFRAWQRAGLIEQWEPGVYEPEAYLFGGPVSMRSVHRLFTTDSLTWLGYHALAQGQGSDVQRGPAWAMSLLMVRILFDVLEIVGWEDLDVWDRVRSQTGRQLGEVTAGNESFTQLVYALRQGWSHPDKLLALLSPEVRHLVSLYRRSVQEEGPRWLADYFKTCEALIGPREAAAYLIVFHWNRAYFPMTRQALIAEALAARPTGQER